jgi:hypothetical protein
MSKHDSPFQPLLVTFGLLLMLVSDGYQNASVRLRLARMVVWSPEGSPVEPGWPVVPSVGTPRGLDHGGSPVRVPLFREMTGSVP